MKFAVIFWIVPAIASACSFSFVEDYSRLEMHSDFVVSVTHQGRPLAGVTVEIFRDRQEQPLVVKTTGADGTAHFDRLGPGNYRMNAAYMEISAVWHEQFHVRRRPTGKARGKLGYTWGDDAEIVGALAGTYLITMFDESDVGGQPKWTPIPLAYLAYENVLTHERRSLGSSEDGTFDFGAVAPGTYLLKAATQIVQASPQSLLVVTPESPRKRFRVKVGDGVCGASSVQ